MSFRCGNCNEAQEAGTKPIKRVAETREKEYVNHGKLTLGTEIVKEVMLCPPCDTEIEESHAQS